MVTDPIGDYLSRIRNGYLAGKTDVLIPHSVIKEELTKILVKEQFIKSSKIIHVENEKSSSSKSGVKKQIEIQLLYIKKKAAIETIKRISSPGRRIYIDCDHLPIVLSGYGIAIISTSEGLKTNREAKKKGIGGEVLCYIW